MKVYSIGASVLVALALSACASGVSIAPQQSGILPASGVNSSSCSVGWIREGKPFRCKSNRGKSWMSHATSGDLLYVSDIGAESVDVFSYPDGKSVGLLTGFAEPNGLCADQKGNVYVTDAYYSRLDEYAHGGTKPIRTVTTGGSPIGCAVDPRSGDLAVTFFTKPMNGNFMIFKKAKGTPTNYEGLFQTDYCSYDDEGDLFIDGFTNYGVFALGELIKNASLISTIPVGGSPGWPGGLQWDGSHVAVGDDYANKFVTSRPYANAVYQLAIKGGEATPVKTVPLNGAVDVLQFSFEGKTLLAPDASNGVVNYYSYPKGGDATETISGFYEPVGTAISK